MLSVSQYAAREGITPAAAYHRLTGLTPPPEVKRERTKAGRWVNEIRIHPDAVYTPKAPGRPRKGRKS